eukprot:PITA_13415
MHFGVEECKFICWHKDTKYGKSLTKASHQSRMNKVRKIWYDAKAKDLIISGLIKFVYLKVLSCKIAKEVWGKLENIYAGDSKVKEAKLQIFMAKFEQLKMREDEDIAAYFQHVDETTNTLEGLGEPVETKIVVQKILKTLPTRFNPKVSFLEDRLNLTNLSVDELHGILTAYEMRIEEEDGTSHLETTFAASKKNSKDKQTLKAKTCNCKDEENEEDEEEFSDKKFVGHFAAKCPHKNEVVTNGKKGPRKFNKQGKKKWFKKSFFTKEDSSLFEEDSDNEEEFNGRVLFMAKHNKQEAPDEEGDEEEEMTEVEFQNKVIRVIKELKVEKKHVNSLEDELKTKREDVLNLKIKVEEYKQIEESLKK